MEGGGLLFISRPFIPIITGLVKGKMCLTEFYRTAIILFKYKSLGSLYNAKNEMRRFSETK